jgi:hypothetical protein
MVAPLGTCARLALATALTVAALGPATSGAQVQPSVANVTPVYEGWVPNPDGSFDLMFGYMNREWSGETLIPLGPNNTMEPGGDLGQPTNFFPRRNRFVFHVRVPADFGSKEIVWTLTSKGRTEKTYGTLKREYALDDTSIMSNIGTGGGLSTTPDMVGNKAPVLSIEGATRRTARVGEPVAFAAVATDDGKPNRRNMQAAIGGGYTLPTSATGLRLSFFVYRGSGPAVGFDPPQAQVWENTRDGGNSPWSAGWRTPPVPDGNRWQAQATFSEPGTYVIRALAHDGGLWASQDITVVVSK